ncbi:MAG: sn-glycerol-3-phosphate import ATP-binding protein UgpC [Cohaesibacteraceae bacterium]|nr:sn-glycerol-3-phosphate import ATP-binding protein UgpC [Cohaesibacteraceae bacterium]MBL4876346.1 sn-glycerol-3-phosphate import ATP-binding protein UgpC [Cohaesibacteraceae bacterium]
MAGIKISDVRKVYPNGFEAARGISIDVKDGDMLVLVGPSGCGKSTLLRMIAGLETVSGGEISIGDRVVNDVEPADRDIAMVFQNYALYPHMTVYNNLAYGLKNRGTPKDEIDTRVREAAAILEIEQYLDSKPKQLSGGQRQRVAMGRAIVRHPQVFLFDEPLSNLDAKLRVQMRMEIRKLQRSLKTTAVYVTHDQLEAMTLADQLVVLNAGLVEQMGAPIEVYEKPASTFVATFIGSPSMNLINVKIGEGSYKLETGETGLVLDVDRDEPALTIGVRPEDLQIGNVNKSQLKLVVEVIAVEPVGAESYVHGAIGGLPDQTIIVRVSGKANYEVGSKLDVGLADSDKLHLFDRQTGKRIEN